jgi:VWFA-related protein
MLRSRALVLGLALFQAASLRAQDRPKPPVFSAGTNLVLVDFVVTDKSDNAVSGLKISDFVVKEDGKERPILSFSAFGGVVAANAGPADVVVEAFPAATPRPVPPPPVITVLFVDDGQLSPEDAARLRPSLKKLVSIIAERSGALALIAPWSKVTLANAVEGNIALFDAGVDKIVGRRFNEHSSFPMADAEAFAIERGDQTMLDRLTLRFVALNPGLDSDQARQTARGRATEVIHDARNRREDAFGVLIKSLDWLVRQPGRHSVVMVSGGFAYDQDDTKQREVVTRSLRANAPIHFIDARGLQGMGTFQGVEYGPALEREAGETPFAFSDAAEGSTSLALDTGGLIIRNTNDITRGVTRLLEMSRTYYVLGYDPPEHKKAGFRKIKVEVLNKNLHVIARRGYFDETSAAR